MNILDIIIILCFCPVLISGYKRGFINQVISIVALIGGVWIASAFDQTVGEWILPLIEDKCDSPKTVAYVIGYGLIFIVACTAISLIGKLIEKVFLEVIPGWIDKTLGLIMGVLNGVLLVCALFLVFDVLNKIYFLTDMNQSLFTESMLFPIIESTSNAIMPDLAEVANTLL